MATGTVKTISDRGFGFIPRSLRNNFRVNVRVVGKGGRATDFEWGPTRLPIEAKLRIPLYQADTVYTALG
jgi:hypothetical protein